MKQIAIILLLYLFLFSCKNTLKKPENLLSENDMVTILEDIYLHKQQSYLVETEANAIDISKIDAQIILKHNSTVPQFKESFHYYVLQPEIYNEILKDVRNNLESKLPESERVKREEERKSIPKK